MGKRPLFRDGTAPPRIFYNATTIPSILQKAHAVPFELCRMSFNEEIDISVFQEIARASQDFHFEAFDIDLDESTT